MPSVARLNPEVFELGWRICTEVRRIDDSCTRIRDKVELGLCNVRRQFAADVEAGIQTAPPRKVKEEDAITWLLSRSLLKSASPIPWQRYPDSNKTCDLVVSLAGGSPLWIEVKLAWKAWQNCDGSICGSSAYKSYLLGDKHRTHSAADDFAKLVTLAPSTAHLGFLLIGFDSVRSPMDTEVAGMSRDVHSDGWFAQHHMWPDRRSGTCRIHCWFWQHLPADACDR
jgi:hypothetical protein